MDGAMTEEDIRFACVAALHEMSMSVCLSAGGYPDDIDAETIPGWVVVATLDSAKDRNAPRLELYRWEQLYHWYRAALQFRTDEATRGEEYELVEALYETSDALAETASEGAGTNPQLRA